ncbi:MAG: hypothetical protein K0Q79_3069 [Flavipsychrobacter sp.]|nr:hypothetical protein [Flavipsychrobacter sp.]
MPVAKAQQYDTASVFKLPIQLDSFVVSSGFDVNAFIRRIKADTTFYKAFKNMRFVPYDAVNDIQVLDKNNRATATLHSKTRQIYESKCRSTKVIEEQATGDFYMRNGEYRYYTAELYAYLFFAKKPVCNETDIVAVSINTRGKGQMEKSKFELKQLIFNPGAPVKGVPFMGDRESIFDQDEAKKYDFKITSKNYDGQDCFVFRITPKKGYERKALYNELTTWFRQSDYSIIARDYSLSYSTLVYDFDVRMKVRTRNINGKLYPTRIEYDGNWHILTKKRERVRFTIDVTY